MDEIRNPSAGHNSKTGHGVHAIAFDLDAEELKKSCCYEWFTRSVRDVRMLRIEDDNDLRPVTELTLEAQRGLERFKAN